MRCSYSAEVTQIRLKLIFDGAEKFLAMAVAAHSDRRRKRSGRKMGHA